MDGQCSVWYQFDNINSFTVKLYVVGASKPTHRDGNHHKTPQKKKRSEAVLLGSKVQRLPACFRCYTVIFRNNFVFCFCWWDINWGSSDTKMSSTGSMWAVNICQILVPELLSEVVLVRVVCPVSEISVPVPWGQIRGKAWGPDHGRPVLCLHGWADNCGTFNTLIPLLPKGTLLQRRRVWWTTFQCACCFVLVMCISCSYQVSFYCVCIAVALAIYVIWTDLNLIWTST